MKRLVKMGIMNNTKNFEIKFQIQGEPYENIKDIIEWFNNQMEEYVGDINSLSIKEVKK
ncbi:MAG: hypothetical protein ISP01_05395 [Methanobrevibacter arboriphilus]|uniref:Uncharacterized protein n=1 Tax=Methanobrevibacter arboriphilus TaxID=39441 RepID=A0A843AFZ8_METAZ|nr:hypothetical protein [Methanobrevibacter arboriphilus]MBF4468823.1 hypothetical protein [Methanobrevibacter arboriphilus]